MSLKDKIHRIIFETDTKAGKYFDVILLYAIVLSVLIVILDSIPELHNTYYRFFFSAELFFSILFGIEYLLRIFVSNKPTKYIFSTWGIIDFLSVAPQLISLLFSGANYLMILRLARMLRVFRILKLSRFIKESEMLYQSIKLSFYKISIFMLFVFVLVIILGTVMYVIEGEENGFTSIPQSIYWAIITITTVGYGDIVPVTIVGKIIASLMMLIGYSILAVPTGIITLELSKSNFNNTKKCSSCEFPITDEANYCSKCGEKV